MKWLPVILMTQATMLSYLLLFEPNTGLLLPICFLNLAAWFEVIKGKS